MDRTQTRDSGDTSGVRQFVADDLLGVEVAPSNGGAMVTVSPTGEVDFLTAAVLRSALLSCLQPPCTHVIVDLDEVTFLNCAGLTVLAEARHLAEADGIRLTLRGGQLAVRRPLQLTGLWARLTASPG
ncbi:STAS domain-containing protein [Blastococcus saxobsidens]|uniref:Anti-sigma factor antagonist n=1 Tax=Blastococcus saxobsidens (strain DD2) TaxID=1146883 RepID=H6RU78_BLASD|nr:STAS domain-containing protein [Blastococcus saxobsidens]CCG05685.1 Anti-anti-sigma regulatory factor (antagonist of anti-sigma factor) [Blastococcus saxobsidens DD2]